MTAERLRYRHLPAHKVALLDALYDIVDQCRVVIDAAESEGINVTSLTWMGSPDLDALRAKLDALAALQVVRPRVEQHR